MQARSHALLAVAIAAALVVAACGGSDDTAGGGSSSASSAASSGGAKTKLSLVAYSTPQVVYDEVIPAFQKTAAGKGVTLHAVLRRLRRPEPRRRGRPAGRRRRRSRSRPTSTRLVKAGLVADDWADTPTKGIVSNSVVALIVRKGNPKNIKTWDDLLKPGVEVLTPNPFTSGARSGTCMAAYGAKSGGGKNRAGRPRLPAQADHQARQGPGQVRPRGAADLHSAAPATSCSPTRTRRSPPSRRARTVDYVIPDQTIKIENPIAVDRRRQAHAAGQGVRRLRCSSTPGAGGCSPSTGYRPVDQAVARRVRKRRSRRRRSLFTIDDLGGWPKVNDEFFDPDKGSVAKIEQDAGVSTAK